MTDSVFAMNQKRRLTTTSWIVAALVMCCAGDLAGQAPPDSRPTRGMARPPGRQGPTPEMIEKALSTVIPDDPATVIAVVGQSPILVGDLIPRVDARVKEMVARSPQAPPEHEVRYLRAMFFRNTLNQTIQLKVLRESFLLAQVGTQSAEKREEAEKTLQVKARQMFQDQELPNLYKRLGVHSVSEVDQKLREQGSSFESNRLDFIDQVLAHLYRSDVIPKDPNIPMVDVKNYFEDNIESYRYPAEARWEQLTATFARSGSRAATTAKITEMGREAYFGGSMQAVARAKSQEPFAARGGVRDWTKQGSLASAEIEQQVFSLPIGLMSEVIEDPTGMHIIRVLERKPAGTKSISDVQDEIRESLKQQKIEEAIRRETSEMTRRVAVWSIFPEDTPGALPLNPPQLARSRPADSK
ncbi:MAG: peptidyl-prolyl cis-trans isomerase [Planctomycetota bacterium]|jgi:parvulin-like peptidyl-prolyl isomerase